MNKLWMNAGIGFSAERMSKASHLSGGHANIRAAVDELQADSINRVCKSILESLSTCDDEIYIVDVGSKFGKMSNLYQRRFELDMVAELGFVKTKTTDPAIVRSMKRVA